MLDIRTDSGIKARSVLITGAAGTGKSTLCDLLVRNGFNPSPNHLTRKPREDELDGVHGIYIEKDEFHSNFLRGAYLEPDIAMAEYSGVLYGSPKVWIEQISSPDTTPIVATPANTLVIRSLTSQLEEMGTRDQLTWVNLYATQDVRRERLEQRTRSLADLVARLTLGVSHGVQEEADMNIDTGLCSQIDTLDKVLASTIESRV